MSYCYSNDEEEYCGDFETRDAALAEARSIDPDRWSWTAEVVPCADIVRDQPAEICGERITELIEERLGEEMGGYDPILEPTKEQHETLGRMVLDWIAANVTATRFGIKNIVEHEPEPKP